MLRKLGKHPVTEKELVVKVGRFGPYVTDGELNASVPTGMDPMEITVDDAVNLLEARAAKLASEMEQQEGGKAIKRKPKAKAKSKAKAKKSAVKKNKKAVKNK